MECEAGESDYSKHIGTMYHR